MMKSTIIFVAATVTLTLGQGGDQNCKPNESYTSCGSACEPSCETPKPEACITMCVEGCQCNKGFFRNSNKDCVELKDCKQRLNASRLSRSSQSSDSSDDSDSSESRENKRNRANSSTQLANPTTCPENEGIVACKNECSEKKCGQTEEIACTKECRGPGCACNAGFFRNTSGSCVSQQECDTQSNGRIRIRG